MDTLKKLLGIFALILGGFVLAGTTGLLPMSDGTAIFLSGVGSLLAMAGVPIVAVTPNLAKTLMVVSGMLGGAVGGYWGHHPNWQGVLGQHWFVVLVKVGGMLGIVAGALGRSVLGGVTPVPAPAVPPVTPPKP